jgi:hypothetical protein
MRIIKRIAIVFLVLVGIVLILGLIAPKEISCTKEIVINKPLEETFDYVVLLKNQNDYSKWALMDPSMKKTFTGTDGTVGFISAWKSENKNVGSGEQEITKIVKNKRIDFELRFKEPMEATNYAWMTTTAVDAKHTKVAWGFKGDMAYPMNTLNLFTDMGQVIGNDFEIGLKNLKRNLER